MKIYTFNDNNELQDLEVIKISSSGGITKEHLLGQTPAKENIHKEKIGEIQIDDRRKEET